MKKGCVMANGNPDFEILTPQLEWSGGGPESYIGDRTPQGRMEEAVARAKKLKFRFALSRGADPNKTEGMENWNTLQKGVYWDWQLKGMQMLVEKIDDIDHVDHGGRTALHLAVHYDRPDLAELFLQHGADANALTNKGEKPLDMARDRTADKFKAVFEKHALKQQADQTVALAGISRRNFVRRSI